MGLNGCPIKAVVVKGIIISVNDVEVVNYTDAMLIC